MEDTKKLIEKYKRELMELSRSSRGSSPADTAGSEPKKAPQVIGYVSGDNGGEAYDRFLTEIINNDSEEAAENEEETAAESAENADNTDETENDMFADIDVADDDSDDMDYVDDETDDDSDGELLDPSDNIFTPPNYVTIPSTEQVQQESTDRSEPSDNDPAKDASGITNNNATTPRPDLADVQSTSKETADRLNDMPISGTSQGEQLTGRSFEDGRTPQNSPENQERNGSQTKPIDYPEIIYQDYEEFQSKNIGRGTMMFRVFAARQAYPVSGVKCVITKKFGGKTFEIVTLTTDRSGQTRSVALPAPSKELSQSYDDDVQPFALYDASVTKNGFADVILHDIPVFDGIQSVQRVSMIPVAISPESELIEEITEVPNADR